MEVLGKPSGLVRRKGSASWQFRQRWPKHLRRTGDPAEVWISLNTTSHREAMIRLPEARNELQRRFNRTAEANPPPPIHSRSIARATWPTEETLPWMRCDQAASLAQSYFSEVMQGLDAEAPAPWSKGDAEYQSWHSVLISAES
jgi:hypothetical protein